MQQSIHRAIGNICKFGDTDVLAHPLENLIIKDCQAAVSPLISQIDQTFDEYVSLQSPRLTNFLAPVGYNGARWIAQIDPLWNIYYLAAAIEAAPHIEKLRINTRKKCVFSYRFNPSVDDPYIFDSAHNFQSYMETCFTHAQNFAFVVQADISDFYGHIRHHRLENALKRSFPANSHLPSRLIKMLTIFSGGYSHGLPIGGPASRILSECFLTQVDRLLDLQDITFCRFADDFTLFAKSKEEAIKLFVILTRTLFDNEGLTLQKSKTKILPSHEFSLLAKDYVRENSDDEGEGMVVDTKLSRDPRAFMRLRLRYDPYSQTAEQDYEALKHEIQRFDIFGMLTRELLKSRVDISFARKLITALRYIDDGEKDEAALSLIGNIDLLLPILPNVLMAIEAIERSLSPSAREKIAQELYGVFSEGGYLKEYDAVTSYVIRLLAKLRPPEAAKLFVRTFNSTNNPIIRRDVILGMTSLEEYPWLSERRSDFENVSPWERRGIIVGSYWLGDEGNHWRRAIKDRLSPFEVIVREWCSARINQGNRSVPL